MTANLIACPGPAPLKSTNPHGCDVAPQGRMLDDYAAIADEVLSVKQTGKCPKCGLSEIIRIPPSATMWGQMKVGKTLFSAVKATRFLCAKCGYSEEWVEKPNDIKKLRTKFGR